MERDCKDSGFSVTETGPRNLFYNDRKFHRTSFASAKLANPADCGKPHGGFYVKGLQ
jgi:hypothetical protein